MKTPGVLILLATLACAARSTSADATSSPTNCPGQVLATVSNPRTVTYDVYYRDPARAPQVIGEISPGSTVTFPLPGEGRGRVYVQRPAVDIGSPELPPSPGMPLPDIRIRIHCAGH